MEEDRVLDFAHSAMKVVLFLLLAFSIPSCSLPRIVVLDDPLTPEEHINLGVIYERDGKYDEAIKEYRKASEELPVAYFYIGNAYFHKGDFERSEEFYKKAIRKDPANTDAMNNLAWLYYRWGRNLDKAALLVKRAIEIRPDKADIYADTLRKIEEAGRVR